MLEEIDSIRQDEELRENCKQYEHPLFLTIQEIMGSLDVISFKEASTRIGRSLVSEFSELDSNESGISADDAVTVSTFESILCAKRQKITFFFLNLLLFRMRAETKLKVASQLIKILKFPSCLHLRATKNIH